LEEPLEVSPEDEVPEPDEELPPEAAEPACPESPHPDKKEEQTRSVISNMMRNLPANLITSSLHLHCFVSK
jgi:hypothetical protein